MEKNNNCLIINLIQQTMQISLQDYISMKHCEQHKFMHKIEMSLNKIIDIKSLFNLQIT